MQSYEMESRKKKNLQPKDKEHNKTYAIKKKHK